MDVFRDAVASKQWSKTKKDYYLTGLVKKSEKRETLALYLFIQTLYVGSVVKPGSVFPQ